MNTELIRKLKLGLTVVLELLVVLVLYTEFKSHALESSKSSLNSGLEIAGSLSNYFSFINIIMIALVITIGLGFYLASQQTARVLTVADGSVIGFLVVVFLGNIMGSNYITMLSQITNATSTKNGFFSNVFNAAMNVNTSLADNSGEGTLVVMYLVGAILGGLAIILLLKQISAKNTSNPA